jgi:glutathione synthase/RimK-type ligase-like ATP-grasp enzyme
VEIALVTYRQLPDLHPDDHPLRDALRALDAKVHAVCWDEAGVDWAGFDAVVLRSCWDYYLRFGEFRRWLDELERAGTRLWNPPAVVRWNYDKIYLADLAGDGVLLPGTEWLAPGDRRNLGAVLETRGWDRAVVKPRVSASGHETWLTDRRRVAEDEPRVARLVAAEGALIQEFVPEVMTAGELSLVYLAGEFSHAVRKRAGPGEFRVQERFGGWTEPATVGVAAREAGKRALARVPGPWLYARVDGVERDAGRQFLVMELEVFEPSLFLQGVPEAAGRLARAIVSRP